MTPEIAQRLHTLAVLLISLPPHRAPPERRVLQRLFTSDTWRLARHVAELLATVLLLGCRCFYGHLESVAILIGGVEHGFYDFPYIGNIHPN
jgi:hypothetical protein